MTEGVVDEGTGKPGVRQRRAWNLLVVQIVALITALIGLDQIRRHFLFDFGEAALGDYTTAFWGDAAEGGKVHCTGLDIDPCRNAWRAKGGKPVLFWIGNSQLHGINRYAPGEKSAVMAAHDALLADGYYTVGYSLPNISMTEIAATVSAVADDYDPRVVLFPVVFNGLRSGSIRDEELPLLRRPGVAERIRASSYASDLAPLIKAPEAAAKKHEGTADKVEDALEGELAKHSALWRSRQDIRALFDYMFYVARHRAFDVGAQSKRSLINSGYESQMRLLEKLVGDLRRQHRDVLLYVPPYRQDIEGPYIPEEYSHFKQQLNDICARTGAHCADIDSIVPGPEWGLLKDPLFGTVDYDFMHFTAKGHASLSKAIVAELRKMGY